MEKPLNSLTKVDDCWNSIGVWGDRSCPQLKTYIHCHNCPVYSFAGRSLLDREPPTGYLSEWTDLLTQEKEVSVAGTIPVLIFRLGVEWLALPAQLCQEVTSILTIHTVPHRSNRILTGLVNIRGNIQLCISLRNLLDLEKAPTSSEDASDIVYSRMVVVEKEGNEWVFPVDEIYGIYRFNPDHLQNVPATVAKASETYTKGMIKLEEKKVSYLDDELLFYNLSRRTL